MDTGCLGGVNPTVEDLAAMQKGPSRQGYILHTRDGKLTKVPAERTRLPDPPPWDMVEKLMAIAPDGTIYFNGKTKICKSTDEGRTWTSYKRGLVPNVDDGDWQEGAGSSVDHPDPDAYLPKEDMRGYLEILSDGRFLTVRRASEGERTDPISVWASGDEGRSWQILSKIVIPDKYNSQHPVYGMYRILPDDTLLCIIEARIGNYHADTLVSGPLLIYRSTDNGRSWEEPRLMVEWCSEGGLTQLPSGKLLAVLRYQPSIAGKEAFTRMQEEGLDMDAVTKRLFLSDSEDQGRT